MENKRITHQPSYPSAPQTFESPHPTTPHAQPQTTLYAGVSHKPFPVPTTLLQSKSPYFQRLLSEIPDPTPEQTTFEDVDEVGMKVFCAWVREGDEALKAPRDWHELGGLLGGYAVAWKFGGEGGGNRGKSSAFFFL